VHVLTENITKTLCAE